MLISDADRTRAVEELRRHCTAGRLDLDAFAARMAEALAAETLADVDHALRDLPRVGIADPSPNPPLFAPGGRTGDRDHGGDGGRGGERGRDGDRGRPGDGSSARTARSGARATPTWRARVIVVLTLVVVAVGAVLAVLAHWVLAAVLVVGWIVGVVQGRIRVR